MEKTKAWRYPVAVIVFWCLVLVGGMIPMFLNAIAPRFMAYREGDLGYLVLQVVSNAIGAGLAIWAIKAITQNRHSMFCMVNCIVAATAFAILTLFNLLMSASEPKLLISMALSVLVLIYGAVYFAARLKTERGGRL